MQDVRHSHKSALSYSFSARYSFAHTKESFVRQDIPSSFRGAVALLQSGTSLVSTHIYNDRLQPCWMYSTTGTALATSRLCTDTATAANMLDLKYNFSLGSDNGNPISITNNRVTDRSQTFTYDQLNRISTAKTTATHASNPTLCWGQAFGYDSTGNWSNLLSIAGASSAYTGCTQGSLSVTVNTKNQITGDTYDAAVNLMTIPGTGGATYVFNTENQMTSTSNSSTQYIYDGDGNRVEKSGSKIYWFGGSEVLDETDMTGSVTNSSFNEYVFFGGNRIARRDSSNNVFYYLADQLGSSRVIVQGGQTSFCYDADFEPFGGEHVYTNTCTQNYKFTGKERDSESNLDNFGARYYASTTGRFMTPDWALNAVTVPYASFGDPQTLNLYTYVQNSPLDRIDADGHQSAFGSDYRAGGGGGLASSGSCRTNDGSVCFGGADQEARNQELARQAQNQKPMQLSEAGLKFLERHETADGNPNLTAYDASGKKHKGDWTIGYGHKIKPGEDFSEGINEAQAAALLTSDVQTAVNAVNNGTRQVENSHKACLIGGKMSTDSFVTMCIHERAHTGY